MLGCAAQPPADLAAPDAQAVRAMDQALGGGMGAALSAALAGGGTLPAEAALVGRPCPARERAARIAALHAGHLRKEGELPRSERFRQLATSVQCPAPESREPHGHTPP